MERAIFIVSEEVRQKKCRAIVEVSKKKMRQMPIKFVFEEQT
jgi:hypothetical protein